MDQHETDVSSDSPETRAEWVAPTLTDLGSFTELTQLSTSGAADAEGQS
jgi:hypothetical protein